MKHPVPGRLRFSGAQRVLVDDSTCRVRVRLEVPAGSYVIGTAEGGAVIEGQLRSAALATLDALRQAVRDPAISLELGDVTTFETFGKSGVMVSLKLQQGESVFYLTGFSHVGEEGAEFPPDVHVNVFRRQTVQVANVAQAVALAVLSATNRLLSGG